MSGGKYVLGGGISGLLWGYYHPDYVVFTDQVGRAITGADAVVWLNDTDLTRGFIVDLGFKVIPVKKKIGYLSGGQLIRYDQLMDRDLDDLLLKKMVPWEAIDLAMVSGVTLSVQTPRRSFTKENDAIRYLAVDVQEVGRRLVGVLGARFMSGYRIGHVNEHVVETRELKYYYDHVVSTLPAPVFARLWNGAGWAPPNLHYCPVTFIVSRQMPSYWPGDEYAMVYDADLGSPVSRVGRFGETWRYEITGCVSDEVVARYDPVDGGVFVNPFGRIVQDVKLEPPPKITFLGRSAEWDYRGLIDRTLEKVHGLR